MAYKFSFADNGIYGADDLNNITKRLVTSGVADAFQNGVPYNLSHINSAGECLYTHGVVPETVSTLKVTADNEAGTAFIYPGTAFFADGAVMEIEAGGHELIFTPGAKHYVYLKNDLTASNTCYPACTQDAPTGDFVLLAEIAEDGTVCDMRTYAMGKLPGYQSNALSVLKIEDSAREVLNGAETTEIRSYNVGNNNFRYLLAVQDDNGGGPGYKVLSLYSFETGSYLSTWAGFSENQAGVEGAFYRQSGLFLYLEGEPGYWTSASLSASAISIENGVLTLTLGKSTSPYSENLKYMPFTLYLF